jgi:hypothetical protein
MKTQEPTVEIVTATPKLVAELRALDTHNRSKKYSHLEYLTNEMLNGKWVLTNQGVGVTVSGFISDGGHRLQAMEEALKTKNCPPIQFILARNIPDESQMYVDIHSKRNVSDVLSLLFDMSICTQIVAVVNVILRVENGDSYGKFSPSEVANKFQEIVDSLNAVVHLKKVNGVSAPVIAAVVNEYHKTQDKKTLTFLEKLISGENLSAGDPVLMLRRWLDATRTHGAGSVVQIERYKKTAAAIGHFIADRKITRLYGTNV